jgi:F0F1-type ATP synthase membrane subunit b/b'
MEKVWEELRKIESKAENIHSETLKKSEELITVANKDAEKLLSVSKKHTEAEANKLLTKYLQEAADERVAELEKNEESIKDLKATVEKHFDKAVDTIFDALLGTIKV